MPNLLLNNYCNLKCPYCFEETIKNNEEMDIFEFTNILLWLSQSSHPTAKQIGIVGGEPTLHPLFNQLMTILNYYIKYFNFNVTLFTNGIFLNEEKLSLLTNKNIRILINYNSPTIMSTKYTKQLFQNLEYINTLDWFHKIGLYNTEKVCLGCNICEEINNYDFFWDIVDLYKLQHIRFSCVVPSKKEYLNNKHLYFKMMQPKITKFIYEGQQRNIQLDMDCGYLPPCYIDQERCDSIYCQPIVDIKHHFIASPCFGFNEFIDCHNFKNYDELYEYLFNIMKQQSKNHKCDNCTKLCQGGCLKFK